MNRSRAQEEQNRNDEQNHISTISSGFFPSNGSRDYANDKEPNDPGDGERRQVIQLPGFNAEPRCISAHEAQKVSADAQESDGIYKSGDRGKVDRKQEPSARELNQYASPKSLARTS